MGREIREVFIIRIQHSMAFAISTQNINITAFDFDKGPIVLTKEDIQSGLKFLPRLIRSRTILDGFRDIFILLKSINTVKPDIVHIDALQDLIPTCIAARMCAMNGHKPTVIAMSRNPLPWENPKRAWLYAKLIKFFSDGFVTLATTHKKQLICLGVSADKLTVIPNPYDPAYVKAMGSYNEKCDKTNKITRIIYVANICERKAQDVLISAASCVVKRYPDVQFELVGKVIPGEEEYVAKLHSLIQENGVQHNIHFTGEIPYDDVITLLQKSDIFVFPTRSEMMPRAVIEAMVVGKPVIASAVHGILDLVQNRKTGLLVQPGNITELSDAICELIENPGLAKTIGLEGQKYVLEFCSPQKVGKQFGDFYEYIRSKR